MEAFRGLRSDNLSTTAVIRFLGAKLDPKRCYFIILDGLDECDEAQIKDIPRIFQDLLQLSELQFKIFWSSRPVVKWLPETFKSKLHIQLETAENQAKIGPDIRKLIDTTLIEQLDGEEPRLKIGDPELPLKIQDVLIEKAQGM